MLVSLQATGKNVIEAIERQYTKPNIVDQGVRFATHGDTFRGLDERNLCR